MASYRLRRIEEDGSKVYQIMAARKRGEAQKSITWTAPATWSQRSIEKELNKLATDLDKKRESGEALTRTEQHAKEAEEAARAAAEAAEAAKIKTVKQYCNSIYIPGKESECAIRTVEYYKFVLENFIYTPIGNIKMPDVQPVMLKDIIQKAQMNNLSYSTVRRIYLVLSQVFDQATKDDVIEVNPMAKVDSPRRKKDQDITEIEIFTDEQLQTIRDALSHESLKWQTYFSVMMDTGCRKGEVCALRWDRINFDNKTLKIDLNAINADGKVIVSKTKNGKSRIVPISEDTITLLHKLRPQSEQFDYVFIQTAFPYWTKPTNLPLSPQSVNHYMQNLAEKNHFDFKCNPHKFRHTAASLMIENGVSLQDAARMIGDNVETIARYYLHSTDDAAIKAGRILHKALGR